MSSNSNVNEAKKEFAKLSKTALLNYWGKYSSSQSLTSTDWF